MNSNRREFMKISALSGLSLGLADNVLAAYLNRQEKPGLAHPLDSGPSRILTFKPHRATSWWCTIEDLQWSQKKITDKIKRRAAAFAEARIDTAINFGFHIRFDYSNYFGQLHGYYANVCEELHKYKIRFMDHYSCNHVQRPRGEAEFRKLHRGQRHHVLLFHDPVAAQYAQYEGYKFNDICEVDLLDGGRGYAKQYQMETFCHNNPDFLDMHQKYLIRLMKEVPFDGIEVDDMCTYAGLTTCGCKYCRERLKKDYDRDLPAFGDESFWGDTTKPMLQWGNYENPAFRDWISMKTDAIVDHVKMIKSTLGDKPLMSCCSSTGPITLNAISLDLEKIAPYLDFFMLENVGTNINSVDWIEKDAEALHQKDIAAKRGNAPAIALSYTIYEEGAYFGWSLSRFWGVSNWSSTLNGRLEEDPADAREVEDLIDPLNNWEINNSDLDYRDGQDVVEVRLVNNRYCRENGWRDKDDLEHWDRCLAWSSQLVRNNVGYRFLRSEELADEAALSKEDTPVILDGVACVSDKQIKAIKTYLSKGGIAWMAMPFATHDEKGFKRTASISKELIAGNYKNLVILDSAVKSDPLLKLISEGRFKPVLRQVAGDSRWAARIRIHEKETLVIHFMNRALAAVPHLILKDNSGVPILKEIESGIKDDDLKYEINTKGLRLHGLSVMSPEFGDKQRTVDIRTRENGYSILNVNLEGLKVYAVVQKTK